MASTDAKPVPQKNVAYRITFPIFDADGDLVTAAASLDSEISKDGGTFTDCTNEATEIATSSGMYYLDLTSTEMNADTVAVIVKTATSGAKTVPIVMYPEEAGDIRVNVTAYGGTAGTFASGRPEVNMTHISGSAVSTTTAQLGVNIVQISTDSAAADNLEAYCDGTTPMPVNAIQVSGDATAADNAELFFDGTGYNASNSTVGTVTTVTNGVNVTQISGDSVAADNAELFFENITTGSVNDAGATTTSFISDLSSATNNFYADRVIVFTSGTLAGVSRPIYSYTGATKTVTFDEPLTSAPANGVTFMLLPMHEHALSTIAAYAADAVWDEDATAHQTQGTFGQAIGDPGADSDTLWALVNTNLDAAVSSRSSHSAADVWAVGTRVLTAGTNINGSTFTAIPWNSSWDAEVQSEVEDALVVHRLDELLNADSDIDGAAPPTVGSVFHELMTKTTGSFTYDQTTDSLEALRDRGDAAWITATGFSTHSAADVWAVGTRVLTAATNISGPIADQVWEEAIADHSGTAGSTAEALSSAGAAGDPWGTALPGAYSSGTAGYIIGNNLNAAVSSRSSHSASDVWASGTRTLTAIDEDSTTLDLDATIRAAVGMSSANMDTQLADIEGKVDDLETRLGTPSDLGSGATIAANLVDIESQTDDIGVAGAGLTVLATAAELAKVPKSDSNVTWNATAAAQIQSEAEDALVAKGLDHLISASVAGADIADDSIIAKMVSKSATADWDSFTNTTDSLEALRDRGDAAWITATGFSTLSSGDVATAVWNAATASYGSAGSYGLLMETNLDAAISTRLASASYTAPLDAAGTRTAIGLATANLDTQLNALPTAAENATAVLTTQMTEGYAADGVAPTVTQALFLVQQMLTDFSISGTTLTVKKLDGSTTAATMTLNDGTSPTSLTRAT